MKVLAAIAATALLVGATTATAASLITSADIKNNSIRSADIKNNSIRGKDIRNRTITLRDLSRTTIRSLRGQRGPVGPRGPSGLVGATGPRGTTSIFYVNSPVVSVAPQDADSATASCPAGSSATGGGVGFATDVEMTPVAFHTVGAGGFTVIAFNSDTVDAHNLQAVVACARR
jgi:hypothetical protein